MQPQITDASLLVIICADLKAWEKSPERYWKHVERHTRKNILMALENFYKGNHLLERDEVFRSCGIAAQTLMLAATAMGYDTCPMDLSDFDEVARIINLPKDHIIAMFTAIGKSVQKPWPRGGQLPMEEVVLKDRFET